MHSYSHALVQSCTCTVMHLYSHALLQSCIYTVMHLYSHALVQSQCDDHLCSMTRVRGKATAGVALRYMSITSFTSTLAHTCPALSPWEPPAPPHPCLPLSRFHSSSVSSTCTKFRQCQSWHVETEQTLMWDSSAQSQICVMLTHQWYHHDLSSRDADRH